jgi:hypothetical protein
MQKTVIVLTVCLLIFISGCTDHHLINNKAYLSKVENAFSEREQLAANRNSELFSIFKKKLSIEQVEALKFLFAYSPLNDLADYNGEFFLANTDIALKGRNENSWGQSIPEDVFLHYVLPFRINNENLDSFRIVYYGEINNRIKGLDAAAAFLEINHWCHEKVSYMPADIRTSGPLSTILSARGRCGEESTFTVAALRTAGIPARQVYTPRWAHCDDNHAWVEVWINGKWFYMGACEPEPVPDRGWFTEPARRAMLIHSKSFGASSDNENTVITTRNFTEVNNLSKYAPTKVIFVRVLDSEDQPVEDASVEYQLYNYAEFYPLAVVPTDKTGLSRFETGLGDLLIWARKGEYFNFKKISVNDVDTLVIRIDCKPGDSDHLDLDLNVPVAGTPLKGPDASLINENSRRVSDENIIRQKYVDTWMKPEEAEVFATKIGMESNVAKAIFNRSMGNYKNIATFLEKLPDSQRSLAVTLLNLISDKDLRDISSDVLSDHLKNATHFIGSEKKFSKEIYNMYVLNPRIANEIIISWRGYFLKSLPENLKTDGAKDPGIIVRFLNENIKFADDENYYKIPITPRGVYELKVSDSFSRNICFVAICRALGIPSRLEPGSNLPQYFFDSRWNDVFFSDYRKPESRKGFIKFVSNEINPVPEYFIHFTLARFENGRYNTLEYDYNRKVTDFKDELPLTTGHYMLVTGNRISDNKILAAVSFFDLNENEHKRVNIEIRKEISPLEKIGNLDLKTKIILNDKRQIELDSLIPKGIVISWIEPEKEPAKHFLNDLQLLKVELDKWGGYFVFLTAQPENEKSFLFQSLNSLPAKSLAAIDVGSEILKKVSKNTLVSDVRLPYIILVNKSGDIIFRSEGYRIGIGDQILKKVR